MAWLAIEFEVDAPQAGPMSDALLELGAQSVVTAVYAPDFDLGVERTEDGWALLAGCRR